MIKSVLCAIDVSNPGEDKIVLQQAARLASLDDAQLDVITVVPDFGMSMVGTFFDEGHHDKMIEEAKEQLNEQVTDALGADANAAVRHIVVFGKTYQEVLNAAQEAKSSVIVVGAHKPDLAEYLLGPNAARIVRHAKTSVYVVRS
ncbi:MAG: universal stress protein [Pseudomonadota bacterium]